MSIYFGSYELYKRELSKTNLSPIVRNFVSGGFAATTLWVVSFPADLVKNRMMAQPDTKPRKYETLRQCIRDVYREEGIRAFYRGFTPSLMRSFPTNGAAFVAAELALHYLP
jgi:solute carrier family 25 carnitine/acylcarnitine transporter 20/29